MHVNHDTVCDSYAYRSRSHGIRYHTDYGNAAPGNTPVGLMHGNLSWGHGGADLQIKGVADDKIENVIGMGIVKGLSRHSIRRSGTDRPTT